MPAIRRQSRRSECVDLNGKAEEYAVATGSLQNYSSAAASLKSSLSASG